MHSQLSEIPTVEVLTGLEIKSLCLRPSKNAVDSEMRPRRSKSGLETKTDLKYYNTIRKNIK